MLLIVLQSGKCHKNNFRFDQRQVSVCMNKLGSPDRLGVGDVGDAEADTFKGQIENNDRQTTPDNLKQQGRWIAPLLVPPNCAKAAQLR
jgi:hypothetical protein